MNRLATCDSSLGQDGPPEWVHLFPLGPISGRDGRNYVLDKPEAVIAEFLEGGIDLPIDYEHQNDSGKPAAGGPVPAAGWIRELQVRDDGLWGRVEWTAQAAQHIAAREYRFVSPTFWHSPEGQVLKLKGAALVHNPNLRLKALASEQAPEAFVSSLAEALGLPATADHATLLATAAELARSRPDPAGFAPVEMLAEAVRGKDEALAEARQLRQSVKIAAALRDGYITPGMKPWAVALCARDESSFDEFLASVGPVWKHLQIKLHGGPHPPPGSRERPAEGGLQSVAEQVCARLGLPPGSIVE